MKRLIFILMLLPTLSFSDIYTWTDSQGVVHFSDEPKEGASLLILPDISSVTSPTAGIVPNDQSINNPPQEKKQEPFVYQSIEIIQPANEETIRNPQGAITVMLKILPVFNPQDKVQLYYDGQKIGEPQSSLVFNLQGLNRGTHTLSAAILDKNSHQLMLSSSITIFMMPPRVNMRKRG